MEDMHAPVAYSLRFYEKQLIRANRFLGLPNALWAAVIVFVVAMGLWWYRGDQPLLFTAKTQAVWLLGGWGALWGLLKYLTPGRQRLKRIAQSEHRAEVTRVALAHGVSIQDVNLVSTEMERGRLSRMQPMPSRQEAA